MDSKLRIILLSICIGLFLIGVGLSLLWYDWRLIVILVVFQTSWNIDNLLKQTRNLN
jgi:hypothetical protein